MIWSRTAFVLFLIGMVQTSQAQIPKNTLMTGGSLGFTYSTDHEDHVNTGTFNFSPVIGGFISRDLVLGVAPIVMYTASSGGYSYIDSSMSPPKPVNVTISTHETSLGLGPFVRYYIPIATKVYVFIHASPSIMATWDSYSGDPNTPTSRAVSANWVIGPGLSVMVTRSVAVEVGLYYQGTYHRSAQFENGNLLGSPGSAYVDNGMVLNVGFQVYLERNKKVVKPKPQTPPDGRTSP